MIREWLTAATEWVVPAIDLIALVVIAYGTLEAVINGLWIALTPQTDHHHARMVWLRFSRWLVAGLTFQLAADIIETSVTPSWDEVGKLAAIAVIRTFLNYFLERDQRELRELDEERAKTREASRPGETGA
jgi:uncharacterized membrane protein